MLISELEKIFRKGTQEKNIDQKAAFSRAWDFFKNSFS
jgi:hypothetical protein